MKPKINWQRLLPFISCIGVVATAYCASKSGMKAQKILEEENYIHNPDPVKDVAGEAKIVWKEYILTSIVMSLTIASIIANRRITKQQVASLTMLGTASGKLLTDYRRAIREVVPDKYNAIVGRVGSYRVHDVQIATPPDITHEGFCEIMVDRPYPGDDEVLFYDELFDIWFRTSLAVVRTAQIHLNRNFVLRGCATISEFYDFIGLDYPDEFYNMGWGNDFLEGGASWIDIALIYTDNIDGEKFFAIQYSFQPEVLEELIE